jgi:hypothetical protein
MSTGGSPAATYASGLADLRTVAELPSAICATAWLKSPACRIAFQSAGPNMSATAWTRLEYPQ